MSSILSEAADAARTELTDDGARGSILRVVELVEETDSDGEGRAVARSLGRPFLLVDLKAVLDYVRGNRGKTTEIAEGHVEEAIQTATDDGGRRRDESRGRDGGESDGRGALSKLFLLGAVVGLGYVLRKRSDSVGQAVSQATDRAREVADETAMRSGEAAQRTEAVAGEAADRIEESGEMAADRVQEGSETAAEQVREGGEMAADRVEEGGEKVSDDIEGAADTAEDAESTAEDKADEMSSDGNGDDEESEE
ncbi:MULTISPECIES: hypothetical protein [Halorussus]|uniref:hypothetical protein n=1 Tax=Halorussus TaxID=1070314 RepID=UPI000E2160F0|nr:MULTISPECIES: hypothetical protein [Halorussus]NHN59737.1 hypothetical protein [Halorussus sp. JP-T4]